MLASHRVHTHTYMLLLFTSHASRTASGDDIYIQVLRISRVVNMSPMASKADSKSCTIQQLPVHAHDKNAEIWGRYLLISGARIFIVEDEHAACCTTSRVNVNVFADTPRLGQSAMKTTMYPALLPK